MTTYPVHLVVEKPDHYARLQLVTRLLAFVVLGMLGLSLGAIFVAAYVALPVFAAARLSGRRDPAGYLVEDGPRVERALAWFAAVYAWFGLATDRLPDRSPSETVRLEIARSGHATPGSALARLLVGLPSALVLAILSCLGSFVWLWAALSVLVHGRVGDGTQAFLAGMQRWAIRLLAYQASVVEPYPPFSFEETARPALAV